MKVLCIQVRYGFKTVGYFVKSKSILRDKPDITLFDSNLINPAYTNVDVLVCTNLWLVLIYNERHRGQDSCIVPVKTEQSMI